MTKRFIILFGAALLLTACSKINQENYSKLSVGMSKAEVEALLGTAAECSGAMGLASCNWGDDRAGISVQFAADKVVVFSAVGLK